ncbi:hypothetical protein Tco_0031934 [Tanacetum coccineum]
MAKKDMHMYVSHLKDAELKTLIATYNIPLDLWPRLPDSNFRMSILPAGDTAIGIYSRIFDSSGLVPLGLSKVITFEVLCRSLNIEPTVTLFRVFQTLSKQGDWFSFAKRGGSAPVCMEVTKSGLKQWKEQIFLIDHRAIPFHMPWRHPDSCITDKIPTDFNQEQVDRLKAHIVKLRDIPEGVLVRSGLTTKSLSKSQMFHSELEEFMRKKEQEIKTCLERIDECENKLHKVGQTHQTFHMIMPSKDKLYNGRKDLGFENPCNFIKAKELTPRLYDEKFIGPGYTLMFLQHSNEALEIEKFKKAREHEIEFANDYRNLNAKKIIIYLEDEVVSLLEKEKKHLGINESLKSKSKESCESEHSQLINQSGQEFESKVSQISVSSSKFKTKNLELAKEMRKRMKHYDKEERVFETKIKKLEKVLAKKNKDFKELEEENNDLRMHNKRLFE